MNRVLWAIIGVGTVAMVIGAIALFQFANGGGSDDTPSEAGEGVAPRTKNELRLLGADPPTMDPALTTDATSARYIVEIFSGLVTINRDLQIAPDLAKRWEVSADGKVYTFKLREDAAFHNGQPVKAQTVKDSLERAADPRTQSPVADVYLGDIVGVRDRLRGRAESISGVKVIDDYTLQITIDVPKPYFIAKLTYPTAFVVDVNQIKANPRNWMRQPNGTGPFKLKQWDLGRVMVLEANTSFYGGRPKLDRATFILSGGAGLTMYENNELDVVGVGLDDIDRVRDRSSALNEEYQEGPNLDISYIGLNVLQPPFDDVKVRQAFAMAIDRAAIASSVLRDLVVPAKGILPPGMPGYNENRQALVFDKDRAKQLLDESKYGGNLPRITLTVSGEGANLGPSSEAIIQMWHDNLGVDVEVQQVEWATFLQEVRRGRYQMWELGWIADYIDPENFLDVQFHSASVQNEMGYINPTVDRLLEQARVEADVQKRLSLYSQVEDLVLEDFPWIPLYHDKDAALIKPYVEGYRVQPLIIPTLAGVSVER